MNRSFIRSIFGTALFICVGQAHANEMFDSFRDICMEAQADNSRAIAIADKAGWLPLPQSIADQIQRAQMIKITQGRIRSLPDHKNILITTHAKMDEDKIDTNVCIILSQPGGQDIVRQAASFAGIPPEPTFKEGSMYIWHTLDGKHVQVLYDAPETEALAKSGELFFLTAREDGDATMLMLSVPIKN